MKKVLILVILLAILAHQAFAVNIGATPGSVKFEKVAKNGYAEQSILLTTNSEEELSGHVDFVGDLAPFITVSTNGTEFNFSREHPFSAKLIFQPPADMQEGNYTGLVSFVTDTSAKVRGTTGSSVKASVAIRIFAEIVGEEFVSCNVGAFSLPSVEQNGVLEFAASLLNNGNVRLSPRVDITIWDQLKRNIMQTYTFNPSRILPTTRSPIGARIEQSLPLGQYWAEISIPECNTNEILTFSVVEPGSIADDGVLEGIYIKPYNYVGEPAEITAVFTNKGPRSVQAQFKGQIYKDNVLVQELDSDELFVDANSQHSFPMIFTPPEAGVYEVRGRVIYNGKLTFEKSITFNSVPQGEEPGSFPIFAIIIYFAILIVIVVLIILIRRELRKGRLNARR